MTEVVEEDVGVAGVKEGGVKAAASIDSRCPPTIAVLDDQASIGCMLSITLILS